jgi:hypothetical protein
MTSSEEIEGLTLAGQTLRRVSDEVFNIEVCILEVAPNLTGFSNGCQRIHSNQLLFRHRPLKSRNHY